MNDVSFQHHHARCFLALTLPVTFMGLEANYFMVTFLGSMWVFQQSMVYGFCLMALLYLIGKITFKIDPYCFRIVFRQWHYWSQMGRGNKKVWGALCYEPW